MPTGTSRAVRTTPATRSLGSQARWYSRTVRSPGSHRARPLIAFSTRGGRGGGWPMDIAVGPYQEGDAARFTGRVWLGPGLPSTGGTGMTVVHFSAGARTHWHAHPGGQFLYGVSGRGRVRSRGGPGHVLEPGDIVHVPAGEWHFHGGAPDSPVVHVAVNGGGAPEWGDPVTDEDYGEGF